MPYYTRGNVAAFALVAIILTILGVVSIPKVMRSVFMLQPMDTNRGVVRAAIPQSPPLDEGPKVVRLAAPLTQGSGDSSTYRTQRNELSKILNNVKQDLAIMSCEMIKLKQKLHEPTSAVSVSGGWCEQSSRNNSGSHAFDKPLAQALADIFEKKSVASFGDGPGDYKRYLDSTQRLNVYDAYDGAPYGPQTSGGAIKFLDLTAPQYGLPVYDWIISLEVAEHIPARFESVYIDNIVRHAGSGIILSWAVPGQGGLSHVNNRPFSYVKDLFKSKGFEHDEKTSLSLRQKATLSWLKNNVNVFKRTEDTKARSDNAK